MLRPRKTVINGVRRGPVGGGRLWVSLKVQKKLVPQTSWGARVFTETKKSTEKKEINKRRYKSLKRQQIERDGGGTDQCIWHQTARHRRGKL